MKLLIISPEHQESHIVEWIKVHTPQGSIIIKQGHAPLIATIIPNAHLSFLLKSGEKKKIMLLRPGFLEVNRTIATALIHEINKE